MNNLCTIVNKHADFANLRLQIEKILTNNHCFEHSKALAPNHLTEQMNHPAVTLNLTSLNGTPPAFFNS